MPPKPLLPPGPRTRRPRGMLLELADDPLKLLQECAAYGDVVGIPVLGRTIYFLNHPEHVKQVLVDNNPNYVKGRGLQATRRVTGRGLLTSEGEFHTRQRRMIQPVFHRQRIAAYAEVMTSYAERGMADWKDGEAHDLHHELMTLTMKIVAKCLFDADVTDEADSVGAAMGGLMEDFSPLDASPLGRILEKLPTPRQRRRLRNAKILDDVVYGFINERRISGEDRGDLLSMLLQAQDVEGDGTGMTDQQLRDEVMTLFLAGHETTANGLAWTFYLLAQHPEVEAKLQAELDSVLNGRLPTLADQPKLKYTRMVFSEALRLYPPAWAMGEWRSPRITSAATLFRRGRRC